MSNTRAAGIVLVLTALSLLPSRSARAQVTAIGGESSSPPPAGTASLRWPDVAYDTDHDVYLAVSGAGRIGGHWFAGDGTLLGASFAIDEAAPYAQAPRVSYASGAGFFVTWHETVPGDATRIRARVVRYGEPLDASSFDVSPIGTNWEMGAASAWSSGSGVLLVAWQSFADTRIGAQRVSAAGELLGAPIVIDPRAYYFRDPAVAYHAASDTFFVAYAGCVGTDDCFVDVQRVSAATGAVVGGPIALDASIDAGYVPELAYVASTGNVLAVWHRRDAGSGSFRSREIAADGSPAAETAIVTDTFGSYDASSLAYAPVSGTLLFVTHGTTAQDVGIELSARGVPLGGAIPFGPASVGGNFNPRVAAHGTRAEWLAVTSSDFATLTAQRFETATRDPSTTIDGGADDASAPDVDAAISSIDANGVDAGSGLDAAAALDAGRSRPVPAGCACGASGSRSASRLACLTISALVLTLGSRRARARAR